MIRNKTKCKFLILLALLISNVVTKSLSIEKILPALVLTDTNLTKLEMTKFHGPELVSNSGGKGFKSDVAGNAWPSNETIVTVVDGSIAASKTLTNRTRSITKNIRPGQEVQGYEVKISFHGDTFNGEVVIYVTPVTSAASIIFHIEELVVHGVLVGLNSADSARFVDFDIHDGFIEIFPNMESNSYVIVIIYSGEISNFGKGISQINE